MWKELMDELEGLTEATGLNAHRVATICRQFLKDRKWLDDVWHGKLDDAEAELSKFSKRMALSLDSLLTMLDFFPNASDWDGADLVELLRNAGRMADNQKAENRLKLKQQHQSSNGKPSSPSPMPAAIASLLDKPIQEPQQIISELATEHDDLVKQKNAEIGSKDAIIARLKKENVELKAALAKSLKDNQKLRRQIEKLRKPKLARA
jgi:hypothetical protein